jgi:hypothetical protein
MVLADSVFGLLVLGLWIFCVVDVIITDDVAMRNLQKPLWLLIVLLLPVLGSILWLVAGRPWPQGHGPGSRPYQQSRLTSAFPEYDRPGRFAATNPDDDEDFLRQVRERAEEQRRRYREQQAEQRRREEQAREQQAREQQAKDDSDG